MEKVVGSFDDENSAHAISNEVTSLLTTYNNRFAAVSATTAQPQHTQTHQLAQQQQKQPWIKHRVSFSQASKKTQRAMNQEARSAVQAIFQGPSAVSDFITENESDALTAIKSSPSLRNAVKELVREEILDEVRFTPTELCRIHDTANVSLKKLRKFRQDHRDLFPSETVIFVKFVEMHQQQIRD